MLRLFLDANIIFTASITPGGPSRRLFELAGAGACELLASRFVLEEAMRNIWKKRPDAIDEYEELVMLVRPVSEPQMARVKACERWLPSKDSPVLAAAIMCAADVLVTGDSRHFKPLWGRIVEGVIVLTPRQALERVLVSGDG